MVWNPQWVPSPPVRGLQAVHPQPHLPAFLQLSIAGVTSFPSYPVIVPGLQFPHFCFPLRVMQQAASFFTVIHGELLELYF